MTPYKQGDVILIPFPFTDFSTFKQRPAVIISASRFNSSTGDVIIAAITSHIHTKSKFDYVLNSREQKTGGLPLPSAVKVGKIITLDQRLIRKRIGHLPKETIQRLTRQLQGVIGV